MKIFVFIEASYVLIEEAIPNVSELNPLIVSSTVKFSLAETLNSPNLESQFSTVPIAELDCTVSPSR